MFVRLYDKQLIANLFRKMWNIIDNRPQENKNSQKNLSRYQILAVEFQN